MKGDSDRFEETLILIIVYQDRIAERPLWTQGFCRVVGGPQ